MPSLPSGLGKSGGRDGAGRVQLEGLVRVGKESASPITAGFFSARDQHLRYGQSGKGETEPPTRWSLPIISCFNTRGSAPEEADPILAIGVLGDGKSHG